MFRFFYTKKWLLWGWPGAILIVAATWYQVHLSAQINDWYGVFYNSLQQALSAPHSVTQSVFLGHLLTFGEIAGTWVAVMIALSFFVSHWVFRWRTSITEYYSANYDRAYGLESCDQRLQDDAFRFTRMLETMGTGLLESIMTLVVFLPILSNLSLHVAELPWFGPVEHSLVWVAIVTALGGTMLLTAAGWRLPKNEYQIQAKEAEFRRELVLHDSQKLELDIQKLGNLYKGVQAAHFRNYWLYAQFNLFKYTYLQTMVIVPYIALTPTIVAGVVTLVIIQQTTRAFSQVETSLQYVIRSFSLIVEFMSVYRRLREFEHRIKSQR